MTYADNLAQFATQASFDQLSCSALLQLKIRILDSLGCALGAMEGAPVMLIRSYIEDFGGQPLVTLIGGGKTSPDRAAFYNSALIRYLDFNDSYLAKGETCHPSDNIGAIMAAAEYAGQNGKEFLAAVAVAYQVLCRLCDLAPVRAKGFDHTTLGSYAVAAGVSRALNLSATEASNAIAISGTAFNALRVTRTGALSNWKGLAYPSTACSCIQAAFLARQGITGPAKVFEGNKGFMDAISGHFEIDWLREDLESVNSTIVKKYNAEIHSQSILDTVLSMRREASFEVEDVQHIDVEVFDVAYNIIGGGEEGDKTIVSTKEEADHSLPYMISAAVVDGQVAPQQYLPECIRRPAVQSLLRRVVVKPDKAFSDRFPGEMPCRVTIRLQDGQELTKEAHDYQGFHSRPFNWEAALEKFEYLSGRYASASLRRDIAAAVAHLEDIEIGELTALLAKVSTQPEC